ncbi:MAG: T9SS type A sorting domain-containing protein, partial [Ignavibacteriales bacterium]|nr:T9SS type A sorting domain-containing protein [Ignavibacteriales bacterium]
QRVNAAGVVQWTADGVPISTATFTQGFPKIASDGVGGALVTWSDYRNGADLDVYAQRVNAAGVVQWTANGVAICKEPNNQFPIIVGDGAGGAIIAWTDYRGSGASPQVYAQRVNDAGVVQWMINGVAISTALNSGSCDMISDGAGGAIIAWQDSRNGGDTLFTDIYSQKVNASGAVQWIANGVSISTALHSQFFPKMVNNSAGGAIITWNDLRNDPNYEDIYAQQIDSSGNLGGPVTEVKNRTVAPIEFALQQNYPNPFNPATTISFNLPSKSFVSLKVFNALGEEVSVLLSEVLPAGTYAPQWNAENLASGVYFYRLQAGNLVETRNLLLLR